MTDVEIAIGSKPFVYEVDYWRMYRREDMKQRRADPAYRERERAQQRAYRRELRVCRAFAGLRFEDQPGAD